jgi:hypothetical protein
VKDALGRETRYEYDGVGRQVATISPLVFDPHPEVEDFVYVRSETRYDVLGRRTQSIENLKQTDVNPAADILSDHARATDYEYDPSGRLTAVILPAVTIDDPANPGTPITVRPRYEYGYDIYGNQRQITTNAYQSGTTVVYLRKDASGTDQVVATRQLSQPVPDPEVVTSTRFAYDELNRQTGRTLPDGLVETSGVR